MSQKRKKRPLSTKEKILYIGLLVVTSILYFGLYLPYVLSQLPPSNQLISYSFPDNKWFESSDVIITDHAKFSQLPVVNDMLIFQIEYRNKAADNLTISPELDVRHSGKITQKVEGDLISLDPLKSHKQQITFYSNETGLNEVTLNARIMNLTNHTIIDTVSGTYYIRLYSQSDIFQSQLNQVTNVGIFLSVGVAVFALIPSFAGSRLTRKQLENDLDEKEKTLRPWIGVEGLTLDKKHDSCRLHYHNYGRLPATSAKYKFKVSTTPITIEDMQRENYDMLVSGNIIFPDFDNTTLITVNSGIAEAARKGNGLLFTGILIEYQYGNEKMGRYVGIFEYKSEVEQFRIVDQEVS